MQHRDVRPSWPRLHQPVTRVDIYIYVYTYVCVCVCVCVRACARAEACVYTACGEGGRVVSLEVKVVNDNTSQTSRWPMGSKNVYLLFMVPV